MNDSGEGIRQDPARLGPEDRPTFGRAGALEDAGNPLLALAAGDGAVLALRALL